MTVPPHNDTRDSTVSDINSSTYKHLYVLYSQYDIYEVGGCVIMPPVTTTYIYNTTLNILISIYM